MKKGVTLLKRSWGKRAETLKFTVNTFILKL